MIYVMGWTIEQKWVSLLVFMRNDQLDKSTDTNQILTFSVKRISAIVSHYIECLVVVVVYG